MQCEYPKVFSEKKKLCVDRHICIGEQSDNHVPEEGHIPKYTYCSGKADGKYRHPLDCNRVVLVTLSCFFTNHICWTICRIFCMQVDSFAVLMGLRLFFFCCCPGLVFRVLQKQKRKICRSVVISDKPKEHLNHNHVCFSVCQWRKVWLSVLPHKSGFQWENSCLWLCG